MSDSAKTARETGSTIIYSERQWVPWYWWLAGISVALLTALQLGMNREMWWFIGPLVMFSVFILWGLWYLSSTVLQVEKAPDGTRWLHISGAQLPNSVVSRSLVVPKSARRNAMGRQLDPAAFVASKSWIGSMAMLVLDDPDDPTPYWLVSTKHPSELLEAFVPDTPLIEETR